MLSQKLKLSLRQETDFFKNSQRCFSPLFSLYAQASDQSKLLIIVPKKNLKHAAKRNQAKRRLYQILSSKLVYLPPQKLVLVLRSEIQSLSDEKLNQELEQILSKLKKN